MPGRDRELAIIVATELARGEKKHISSFFVYNSEVSVIYADDASAIRPSAQPEMLILESNSHAIFH